jgi:hypothetical protein
VSKIPSSVPHSDRIFFSLAGLWFTVLTFVGFSPTFYLRTSPGPLPAYLLVHGVVNSAWVGLFLIQALLISTHHRRLHIVLGGASVFLLVLIMPLGFHVVLIKAAAGLKTVDEAGFNLTGLTLASVLAWAGLAYRNRPFVHKRLMLFATLVLTVAAADRASLILGLERVRIFRKLLAVAPGLALVCYDTLSLRRIPILSLSLLALVWALIWYVVTDLIFLHSSGESIIRALTKVFVW